MSQDVSAAVALLGVFAHTQRSATLLHGTYSLELTSRKNKKIKINIEEWGQFLLFRHYMRGKYVGHLESKERLRIQPAQLFNFS